jgi:hypothetical protein
MRTDGCKPEMFETPILLSVQVPPEVKEQRKRGENSNEER